jgi:hypothetical protein
MLVKNTHHTPLSTDPLLGADALLLGSHVKTPTALLVVAFIGLHPVLQQLHKCFLVAGPVYALAALLGMLCCTSCLSVQSRSTGSSTQSVSQWSGAGRGGFRCD